MLDNQIEFIENSQISEMQIYEIIKNWIEEKYGLGELIILRENKTDNSIVFINSLALTFTRLKKADKLLLIVKKSNLYKRHITLEQYNTNSQPDFVRLAVKNYLDLLQLKDMFLDVFFKMMGNDFSCCSHYVECSDLLRCVKEDKSITAQCYYFKNLISGKIFYGKNENIQR